MIRTGCFSVIAVFVAAIMIFSLLIIPVNAAENENMIYVSQDGNDSNDGSETKPFRTINKAILTASKNFDGDATIYICGKVTHSNAEGSDVNFSKWTKTLKITGKDGGFLDFTNQNHVNFLFNGPVIIDKLTLNFGAYQDSTISRIVRFYNLGNRFELGENVVCENNSGSLYIIGRGVDSEENGIFLKGGSVGTIWLALDSSPTGKDVYLTVSDNAMVQTVFTGSSGTNISINGHISVVNGGTITNFYAGGQKGKVLGDVELICSGGKVTNAYGTSNTGDVNDGNTVFYLCTDDANAPSSVTGFDEVCYFSASSDNNYSANVKTKSKATCIYTTRFDEGKGSAGNLDILGTFEVSPSVGESENLLYYMIPIGDIYHADGNFRVLNERKEVMDATITNSSIIVNALSSFTKKGYIAYDSSSGSSPVTIQSSSVEKEIPPIPILEVTNDPSVPNVNVPEEPDTAESVDLSLIIMLVLTVVILAGGVIGAATSKKST